MGRKTSVGLVGTYEAQFLGSEPLEEAQRHDLASTNAAIGRVLARRDGEAMRVSASIYGFQCVSLDKKQTKQRGSNVVVDLNCHNILLTRAQDRILWVVDGLV